MSRPSVKEYLHYSCFPQKENMSAASTAIGSLDKLAWRNTSPSERLSLLKQIQLNLFACQADLGEAEATMKNSRLGGEKLYTSETCRMTTVIPIANNISAAIDLYTALVDGKPFQPKAGRIVKVNTAGEEVLYDIPVAPNTVREMVFYGTRADRIRIKGEPVQKGPYDKPTQLVAVLGAGNYSSAVEIIKALFFDGYVVAHKPHPLNSQCDTIWATRIFQPLVEAKALAFCDADQGPAMTQDPRVDIIYFTGGAATAQKIRASMASQSLVCEAGGVNPVLIVPGDRPWTTAEVAHHAQQIVSMGKVNGGAVCARPQLLVTCEHWSQRQEFLHQIELAIRDTTFACGSYYPGATGRMDSFEQATVTSSAASGNAPVCRRLKPEGGVYSKHADVLWIVGDKLGGYCSQNEAFAQIFAEVTLPTKPDATSFLEAAVDYCNDQVCGTLCACLIVDETTRKQHQTALEAAVTNLQFGTIGINLLPAYGFFSPYLTWGGADPDDGAIVSGRSHFGNAFGYENVQKAIIDDAFVSPGQLKSTNKAAMNDTIAALSRYSVWNSWLNLLRFLFTAIWGTLKSRDW